MSERYDEVAMEEALASSFGARLQRLSRFLGAAEATAAAAGRAATAVSRATTAGNVCIPLSDLLALADRAGSDSGGLGQGSAEYASPEQAYSRPANADLPALLPDDADRFDEAAYAAAPSTAAGEPGIGSAQAILALRATLFASGVVCDGADERVALLPLVIDAEQRLYLARYFDYERELARALVERSAASWPQLDSTELSETLRRHFNAPQQGTVDWQQVATALALEGGLTIISGGPGTGKTTTVVGILSCLLERQPQLRVALAAPTGKAAQRMLEALSERAKRLPGGSQTRLPETAYTLHRLLGQVAAPSSLSSTAWLPFDVVVVDEASMLDVALAARLLRSLGPRTRLILLGDKDQLAAVEAGAVFAELSRQPNLSVQGCQRVAMALQIDPTTLSAALPVDKSGLHEISIAQTSPLADSVVWLERNYRFGLESPIGQLSLAIRAGDAVTASSLLTRERPAAAANHFEDDGVALSAISVEHLADGYIAYAEALAQTTRSATTDPTALFDALAGYRVLCAVRAGPRGVDAVNALLSLRVRRQASVAAPPGSPWFIGRPVMIGQNDYALGLFNGDLGIALPAVDGSLRVMFAAPGGGYRAISPAALPRHETAFALTVHKSQGSEFEHIALILPAQFNRVLSRELIYTAVTRARSRVDVIGAVSVMEQAIGTRSRRASGLAARLSEAIRDDPIRVSR